MRNHATGVCDLPAGVAVAAGVALRETGVTVAGAATALAGAPRAANPERLTRRKNGGVEVVDEA
jgi:hypothetical protein